MTNSSQASATWTISGYMHPSEELDRRRPACAPVSNAGGLVVRYAVGQSCMIGRHPSTRGEGRSTRQPSENEPSGTSDVGSFDCGSSLKSIRQLAPNGSSTRADRPNSAEHCGIDTARLATWSRWISSGSHSDGVRSGSVCAYTSPSIEAESGTCLDGARIAPVKQGALCRSRHEQDEGHPSDLGNAATSIHLPVRSVFPM
jgi:hypothetical protein